MNNSVNKYLGCVAHVYKTVQHQIMSQCDTSKVQTSNLLNLHVPEAQAGECQALTHQASVRRHEEEGRCGPGPQALELQPAADFGIPPGPTACGCPCQQSSSYAHCLLGTLQHNLIMAVSIGVISNVINDPAKQPRSVSFVTSPQNGSLTVCNTVWTARTVDVSPWHAAEVRNIPVWYMLSAFCSHCDERDSCTIKRQDVTARCCTLAEVSIAVHAFLYKTRHHPLRPIILPVILAGQSNALSHTMQLDQQPPGHLLCTQQAPHPKQLCAMQCCMSYHVKSSG